MKRQWIDPNQPSISIVRQCELIDLSRSSNYYTPVGESDENLQLMRLIDEQYTRTPFYGSPKMTAWLHRQGHAVNHKRVERLMRKIGLQAIYPHPKTSLPAPGHRHHPYLLRGVEVLRPDQVWASDIERHEALLDRVEVKGDSTLGPSQQPERSWGQPEPGDVGEGGKQPRQRRDGSGPSDDPGPASETERCT